MMVTDSKIVVWLWLLLLLLLSEQRRKSIRTTLTVDHTNTGTVGIRIPGTTILLE
jgi:hypothetical protein